MTGTQVSLSHTNIDREVSISEAPRHEPVFTPGVVMDGLHVDSRCYRTPMIGTRRLIIHKPALSNVYKYIVVSHVLEIHKVPFVFI